MPLLKNILILIVSLLIALGISELTLRIVFPHTPVFSSYFPRYTIDGNLSYVSGLTKMDPVLPFSAKPFYKHTLSDRAYHPKPYKITLDSHGYRNKTDKDYYDNVIVGDSVAFGSGVNDDETVSAILGQSSDVYNLSISGAGPAMYMVMIDSFLAEKQTKKITVLFYLGNDIRNLQSASWDSLSDCLPPAGSKIRRKDVSAQPESPPVILSKPFLRSSYLFHFLINFLKKNENSNLKHDKNGDFKDLHAMISRKAVTDIRYSKNIEEAVQPFKKKAVLYLNELNKAECTDDLTKLLIQEIIHNIEDSHLDSAIKKTRSLVNRFINKGCYPIGTDLQNLVSKVNYFGGYFYESVFALKSGCYGNIYNYVFLLKTIGETYSDLKKEAENLIELLLETEDLKTIEFASSNLQLRINQREEVFETAVPIHNNCDKFKIFFDYLLNVQKKGVEVFLVFLPAEYELKRRSIFPGKTHSLMKKAKTAGIKCTDLTPLFLKHYLKPLNNALYLDGAHFTVEGNKRVAEWIREYKH